VGARGIEHALTSNHPDGSEYTDLAPRKVKIMLKSSGAMAVALVAVRYQGKRGEEFWRGVSDPDGFRSADPRKVYREYLLSQPKKKGHRTGDGQGRGSGVESFLRGQLGQ